MSAERWLPAGHVVVCHGGEACMRSHRTTRRRRRRRNNDLPASRPASQTPFLRPSLPPSHPASLPAAIGAVRTTRTPAPICHRDDSPYAGGGGGRTGHYYYYRLIRGSSKVHQNIQHTQNTRNYRHTGLDRCILYCILFVFMLALL